MLCFEVAKSSAVTGIQRHRCLTIGGVVDDDI